MYSPLLLFQIPTPSCSFRFVLLPDCAPCPDYFHLLCACMYISSCVSPGSCQFVLFARGTKSQPFVSTNLLVILLLTFACLLFDLQLPDPCLVCLPPLTDYICTELFVLPAPCRNCLLALTDYMYLFVIL